MFISLYLLLSPRDNFLHVRFQYLIQYAIIISAGHGILLSSFFRYQKG